MTAAALGKCIADKRTAGLVCTFYSYKGGAGRSMALANVAALLAQRHRVLIADFHLDAPGLEQFFRRKPAQLHGDRGHVFGVLDLIESHKNGRAYDWRDCLLYASVSGIGDRIAILTAGSCSTEYTRRVQELDWPKLFDNYDLGWYLEELRRQWISDFDFVFIDSPSGISDIAGICTIQLPDVLALFFTTNHQSLDGIVDVMKRAKRSRSELMVDRSQLVGIPVLARDESRVEYRRSLKWRNISAEQLSFIYDDWLPMGVKPTDALLRLRIPYVPYWSLCEQLAVAHERIDDPESLGCAYNLLARLIEHRLDWHKAIEGQNVGYKRRTPLSRRTSI